SGNSEQVPFCCGFRVSFGIFVIHFDLFWALAFNTLLQYYSAYVGVPALYFGIAVGFRTWEARSGKEILSEGRTFYSMPKGLSWQEKYQYRAEQWYRLRIKNSGEQEASSKV